MKKGVRKGEQTFVAIVKLKSLKLEIVQEPTAVVNILKDATVVNVLKEFAYVTPYELPKTTST